MGVVHKLKPEVAEFILVMKQTNPELGCRVLAKLAKDRFGRAVSKSSINNLIKSAGLSMPVGRRRRLRRGEAECPGLGVMFLKAADELLGLSQATSRMVHERLGISFDEAYVLLQHMIYAPLFGADSFVQAKEYVLRQLVGRPVPAQESEDFVKSLDSQPGLVQELAECAARLLRPVWYTKVDFSDGTCCYLDGQLHTVWSKPQIPAGFATSVHKARLDAQALLSGNVPLSLFLAPGYESPTREFSWLLKCLRGETAISKISLYGANAEEIEQIPAQENKTRPFVCGIWPWQYAGSMDLRVTSEFRRYIFLPLKKEYFIASVEMGFARLKGPLGLSLQGIALKNSRASEITTLIAANYAQDKINMDSVANEYFSHWADPEETLKDYSRKIEDNAHDMAHAQGFFPEKEFNGAISSFKELMEIFRQTLDMQVRRYFLPQQYTIEGNTSIQERFYSLKGILIRKKEYAMVNFKPSPKYAFCKALLYACQRVNQARLSSPSFYRIFFKI